MRTGQRLLTIGRWTVHQLVSLPGRRRSENVPAARCREYKQHLKKEAAWKQLQLERGAPPPELLSAPQADAKQLAAAGGG